MYMNGRIHRKMIDISVNSNLNMGIHTAVVMIRFKVSTRAATNRQ
jgi:hypothetical protein